MTEANFQRSIIQFAEIYGWMVQHNAMSKGNLRARSSVGFPDLILVSRRSEVAAIRKMLAIEVKTGRRTTTNEQLDWLSALDDTSCTSIVAWHPGRTKWTLADFTAKERWPRVEMFDAPQPGDFGLLGERLRRGVSL